MPKTNNAHAYETLCQLGAPKSQSANIYMLDTLCRAVMRNPSLEAQNLIDDLKKAIAYYFHTHKNVLGDAQIQWLLSTASESRGHLLDALAFHNFCNFKMEVTPSININVLDEILTAINYCRYTESTEEFKETQKLFIAIPAPVHFQKICIERAEELIYREPRITHTELTTNAIDDHNKLTQKLREKKYLIAPNSALSTASGYSLIEGLMNETIKKPGRQVFLSKGYSKLSQEAEVPLLGHFSGTIPTNLALAHTFLCLYERSLGKQEQGLTKERAELLTGLTMTTFYRAKSHSPHEVYVGFEHYLNFRFGIPKTLTNPRHIEEVKELFRKSIQILAMPASPIIKQCISEIIDDLVENPSMIAEDKQQTTSFLISGLDLGEIGERCAAEFEDTPSYAPVSDSVDGGDGTLTSGGKMFTPTAINNWVNSTLFYSPIIQNNYNASNDADCSPSLTLSK